MALHYIFEKIYAHIIISEQSVCRTFTVNTFKFFILNKGQFVLIGCFVWIDGHTSTSGWKLISYSCPVAAICPFNCPGALPLSRRILCSSGTSKCICNNEIRKARLAISFILLGKNTIVSYTKQLLFDKRAGRFLSVTLRSGQLRLDGEGAVCHIGIDWNWTQWWSFNFSMNNIGLLLLV